MLVELMPRIKATARASATLDESAGPAHFPRARPFRAEFLTAIDETLERVVRYSPHLGSPPGIDAALGIKRVFMKRFPYSVYFMELPTRIRILAVAHAKRRPMYWRDRI
jgi:toxin ParE1/3/4